MAEPSRGEEFAFQLRGVGYRVQGRSLLRDVDLGLRAGRFYALLGHNGSGKSTLMNLMARQLEPSTGHISFEAMGVRDWAPRAFARRVAYLPQRLPEATGLTVRELARFGRYPWHGALGRFSAEDRRRVEEALDLTGTAELEQRSVDTLSGGERQRAWLAMLVAQDSRCMLLDEPISALDVAHQVEVMELVRRLSLERRLTVVAVLHDVNIAARFCDELVALRAGELIAQGPPEDVVSPPVLEQIYGIPMGVMAHPHQGWPLSFVA